VEKKRLVAEAVWFSGRNCGK